MIRILIPATIAIALLLSSCTETFVGTPPEDGFNPGDTIAQADSSWFPMSIGSFWTYSDEFGTFTVTVRTDTVINGLTYNVFASTAGQNRFLRREKNTIFEWQMEGIQGEVAIMIESDTAAWDYTVLAGGFFAFRNYWITEAIGIRRFVGTKLYDDVLHVSRHIDQFDDSRADWEEFGEVEYYYAAGIGLIEVQTEQPVLSARSYILQDYFIAQ